MSNGTTDVGQVPEADVDLTCPRCMQPTKERFYGPCETCRADLRASQSGVRSDAVAAEYEPKMNVTPNAVASKD